MKRFWFFVVSAGLAAGVLLPLLVVKSDDITSRLRKGSSAVGPEVEIDATEVRAQPVVLPKAARQPVLKERGSGKWYRKNGRWYQRSRKSRRSRLNRESQRRIEREDQLAFRQAERFFRVERAARPE